MGLIVAILRAGELRIDPSMAATRVRASRERWEEAILGKNGRPGGGGM
jgi:hypothetical protein